MSEKHGKSGLGFWSAVVTILLVLYLLSVVPVTYLYKAGYVSPFANTLFTWFYAPLRWLVNWLGLIPS